MACRVEETGAEEDLQAGQGLPVSYDTDEEIKIHSYLSFILSSYLDTIRTMQTMQTMHYARTICTMALLSRLAVVGIVNGVKAIDVV